MSNQSLGPSSWTQEDLNLALGLFQAYWPTAGYAKGYPNVEEMMRELLTVAQNLRPTEPSKKLS